MALSEGYPRGFRLLVIAAGTSGLLLQLMQRWFIWRALEGAPALRQRAALVTWHLGMLRSSYYPAAGQRYVPWIQGLSIVGLVLLLVVAGIFGQWARRSTIATTLRAG